MAPDNKFESIRDGGRSLYDRASIRRVILRTRSGRKIVDLPMTAAVAIVIAFMVFVPLGALLTFGLAIAGIWSGVRVEVVRLLSSDDDVLHMDREQH